MGFNGPYGWQTSQGQMGNLAWDAHRWGRQQFAGSFSRGGWSSVLFAPTQQDAFNAWRFKTLKEGSTQHISNLEHMLAQNPGDEKLTKLLKKARKPHKLGGMFGRTVGAAFVALPMFTTPGGLKEKTKATISGAAGYGGMLVGAKAGGLAGAAVGSAILPGLGTLVGGGIGALVGTLTGGIAAEEAASGLLNIPDTIVERERKRRNLNWVGDMSAFNTPRAATMRQMSLQAMNRGLTTARSALGREAIMLHR